MIAELLADDHARHRRVEKVQRSELSALHSSRAAYTSRPVGVCCRGSSRFQ